MAFQIKGQQPELETGLRQSASPPLMLETWSLECVFQLVPYNSANMIVVKNVPYLLFSAPKHVGLFNRVLQSESLYQNLPTLAPQPNACCVGATLGFPTSKESEAVDIAALAW